MQTLVTINHTDNYCCSMVNGVNPLIRTQSCTKQRGSFQAFQAYLKDMRIFRIKYAHNCAYL